ncbi:anthranilate synthase component I family protein, partial [Oceanospirillaceae bacterium]|nr:anthranilate synthase component I family protein [Oceanospirillaceae bacterium]
MARKPSYVTVTSSCDFFELFKKIEQRFDTCYMLESLGEDSHISRYSLIGFDPEQIFWANENQLNISHRAGHIESYESDNPYYLLRDIVPQNIISRRYAGGLTGYIGYDAMNYFEPSLSVSASDAFDAFKFGLYKDGLIYDKMTGELIYFHYEDNRIDLIEELINAKAPAIGVLKVVPQGEDMNRQQHADAVQKVKADIVEGKIFQCEVGFKYRFDMLGESINLYEQLRIINPSPQMYYI